MGNVVTETLQDWGNGVITAAEADSLPPNSARLGWNSALTKIASDQAIVSKRRGLTTINASAITGASAIIGQYLFRSRSSGALTNIHLAVSANGRLDKIATDGTITNLSTSLDSTSPNPPDFETANNLCFICNGTDKLKVPTAGTSTQNWGIDAPSAPTISATGVGGMTGDYEVALSYYNSTTGAESSRSPTSSVTLASQKLRVLIPDAADPQVDYVRIHIRKTTLSAYLFRVASGTGYSSTGSGWADNYGNVDLDLSDSDLNNLLILSPDESENDPPPSGIRYNCWHNSRMFAADDKTVYYSKVGLPESFDPEFFFDVNPDDGQLITGLHSSGGILLIFKTNSIWALYGDDPNTWYVRVIVTDLGTLSFRSILTIEDKIYFWSHRGPMQWDGASPPTPIGQVFLQDTLDLLEPGQFYNVIAGADSLRSRVIFAVAPDGATRNSYWLPFNYRLSRWDASKWDPIDAASFGQLVDSNEQPFLMVGSYQGQVFSLWTADNDGVPSGTTSGTFTAGSTSISTITGTGFLNTGGKLAERKVTLLDSNGAWVARGTISSNDATTLTLASAISGLTSGAVYQYYIGGPDFQWATPWSYLGEPLRKKRFEYVFLAADAEASTTLTLDLAFDFNPAYGQTKGVSLTAPSTTWDDSALWTARSYSSSTLKRHRVRIGRTGAIYSLTLRNAEPDKPIVLRRVAVQAEMQTTKVG